MKASEITIEVNAKITMSNEMTSRCLRLLEFWLNDNPDCDLICEKIQTLEGERRYLKILPRFQEEE